MATPLGASDQDVYRAVLGSPAWATALDDLAARTGKSKPELRKAAEAALGEMAAEITPGAIKVWDRMGRSLTRSYVVDADTSTLGAIRELGRKHSLVFLPNHRSYLDPLVLRNVLARHGFPPNFTLGGINLAMWPMSELGKRSGLIFIRRTTKDDPTYPIVLRLYLGHLIRRRANLEWYFEGGRTRTGKLRPPKMGVLRYLVDAFVANDRHDADQEQPTTERDDVYLVPVAIVYDQQHEIGALSVEESGGSKTPESLSWLVQFARAQGRRRGRAHVRFGEPLSLREAVDEAASRAGSPDPNEVVPRVAFEVAHRINAVTPITPSALVTFGLLDNDGRAMTLPEVLQVIEPLVDSVRERGLPLTSDVDLRRLTGLRVALRTLVREGVVEEYDGGLEPVYAIARERQHEAAFYRNTVTHYFIHRAVAEVAAVQASLTPTSDVPRAMWTHALALRDLLKYEFFFPTKREFGEELESEVLRVRPDWRTDSITAEELARSVKESELLIAHRVIGPFLEAYRVVADRLALREPAAPLDVDDLVSECLGVARQRWLQHQLHSGESITKDLMLSALKLAENRGLMEPGGDDVRRAREAFAAELAAAVEAISVIRRIALQGFVATSVRTSPPGIEGSPV